MTKRAATNALTQDNWDKEEEIEEPGIFQTASSEVLQTRVIKTAKRRIRMCENSSEAKPSPFSNFSGFGKVTAASNVNSPFSFLNQSQSGIKIKDPNETGLQNLTNISKNPVELSNLQSTNLTKTGNQKNLSADLGKPSPVSENLLSHPLEHVVQGQKLNQDGGKVKLQNLELLKDLNLSCSNWISDHIEKNPFCILTPIFKDYEKHLLELNLNNAEGQKDKEIRKNEERSEMGITENCNSQRAIPFISTSKDNDEYSKSKQVNFVEVQQSKSYGFQFDCIKSPFDSTPVTFSVNKLGENSGTLQLDSRKEDIEESEEPPKNDFVPVTEEGSIFDIKCKIFVKKEGNYVSRGVGTLFLKPVKGSRKTQVVIRAHTNLGNILLNILLSPDTPVKKTGKNNAMIICIPTPESKPPPVPVLIRVKTSEECDILIKKIEECKGT